MFNGEPIVLLLTGDERPSANQKTGPMLQTWYLLRDIPPTEAVRTKLDYAICGSCEHRGSSCYVIVGQAPRSVWLSFQRGHAVEPTKDYLKNLLQFRELRIGAYGDPASAPSKVTLDLIKMAKQHVGYTAQWRNRPEFRGYLMASVNSSEETLEAARRGWKSYRIKLPGEPNLSFEHDCPSPRVLCNQCMACSGDKTSRTIQVHGCKAKINRFVHRHTTVV